MIFGLTIFEFVMCLAGVAILLYLIPYIFALILVIAGVVTTVVGLIIEKTGRLLGGKK